MPMDSIPVKLVPAAHKPVVHSNGSFLWALMQAIANDQSSMQNSQMIGAITTEFAAHLESSIYAYWNGPNGPLQYDNTQISDAVKKGGSDESNQVTQWNTQYNADSARAQAAEGQSQNPVDSGQQSNTAITNALTTVAQSGNTVTDIVKTGNQFAGQVIG